MQLHGRLEPSTKYSTATSYLAEASERGNTISVGGKGALLI